jgi:hypothetical protein
MTFTVNGQKQEISDKAVYQALDQILSPFEDMTEYALARNERGVLASLSSVEKAENNLIFEKNISAENIKIFNAQLIKLKALIKQKNYPQIALASTELFGFNINHFIHAKRIENQIYIEHLDYMGFKILALLNHKSIDWQAVDKTISDAQKQWLALSPKVRDRNLKESFNYLFEGLHLSTKQNHVKMSSILASMDLSLVDVLENSF